MAKSILITGITGFVGSHMADFILEQHPEVQLVGVRRHHLSRTEHVRHLAERVRWLDADLTDPIAARRLIERAAPDAVFHFASESFVSPSWEQPSRYMAVNYNGTLNVLDALVAARASASILIPGSGEEYGEVPEDELPITEETALRPVNPYAVTKIAQDFIGAVYHRTHGLRVVRTRAFNHEGPRREHVFGIPSYARQIALIERGEQPPVVKTGHIDDRRNFTHVRDMVAAYWLAMQRCEPGELYVIGAESGRHVWTFREVLEHLIGQATVGGITYEQDRELVRPTNVPRLIADASKFRRLTGWQPTISVEEMLSETLEYWRERVRASAGGL